MTYTQKDLLKDWNELVGDAKCNLTGDYPFWSNNVIVEYNHAIRFLLTQCQMTLLSGDSEMRHNLANQIEEFIK